jgi:predicted RNase H-like nuclease (RuvC/YqgF family)
LIHHWVQEALAQVERAFDRPSGKRRLDEAKDRKIAHLEAKLANKNEVIAELMQEHVQLKKELGDL